MRRILLSLFATTAIFALFAQTQVGLTTYDLQTNTTVCRRVAMNAAGQVAITYTRSHSFDETANDRGTGYNFWNGSAWNSVNFNNTTPGSFTRPDVGRTGWPNIGFLRSGREIVVSHFAGSAASFGGLQVQYRNNPGTGAWTTVSLNSPADIDCTWPRIAISGDSIMAISSAQIGTFFNGVDGGIYMHRSFNGGQTWQPVTSIAPINGDNFTRIGADVYAIDANDNGVVAIVVGQYQINLLKSTDFGTTWTMTPIQQTFDFNGNLNPSNFSATFGETLDTIDISDQAYSLVVDDNGLVHVWYGRQRMYKNDPGTEGAFFFPFQAGLTYWNENMNEPKLIHATRIPAEDIDDCAPLYSTDPQQFQAQLYRSSFTSMASGGFDSNGNLYVAYSGVRGAIVDGLGQPLNIHASGTQFRDVFVMKSEDGGETWVGPLNVSNAPTRESVYPGIPRKIYNNQVPVIWQEDDIPSTALQAPPGFTHPYIVNQIYFEMVSLGDIVSPADITCPTIALQGSNQMTLTQGCLPEGDFVLSFFDIDDVPQGPDPTMLRFDASLATFNTPGNYTIRFWAEDNAGNASFDTLTVLVTVVADNTPPTVNLIGLDTLAYLVTSLDPYADPGITFSDNGCEPSITAEVDNVNTGGPYTPGTFGSYSYTVTDKAGNSTTVIRYIEYISSDNTPPVITVIGSPSETVEACSNWVDLGATAFDNLDFDLTDDIVVTGSVNINVPGPYTITYTVTDNAGNSASANRLVTVVDNTAPVITINDEGGLWYNYLGEAFVAPTADADDCVDANPTLTNNGATAVNINQMGTYTVTFTAQDFSGNQSTATTNVIVGIEPTADFEIIQVGSNIIVSNTSTGSPTFWRWNYGNGQIFLGPNPPSPTYQVSDPTYPTYDICLTVRNRFNDAPFSKPESTTCKTVTVPTSIIERNALDASVSVFPNPTNGVVNIAIEDIKAEKLNVSVTNVIGEKVAEEVMSNISGSTNVTFNLSNKAAGMYFINISTNSASVTKKVMLQ
jgi:hypothetical protein